RRCRVSPYLPPLSPELERLQLSDVLQNEVDSNAILRLLEEGQDLTGDQSKHNALYRSISMSLLENCRTRYSPTHVERQFFMAKLLRPFPQIDILSVSNSEGPVAKHGYY
ncbi:hypothetical protein PFISCL1PPCAC_12502, partial [Pristionchus fissidentatus]